MEYKLFDDVILLQSLLKDLRIIPTGGAVKSFLAETTVLLNGQDEKRRRKQLKAGDTITIPSENLEITIVSPSYEEIAQHEAERAEEKRVAALVKEMNQSYKAEKKQSKQVSSGRGRTPRQGKNQAPVRFPGR